MVAAGDNWERGKKGWFICAAGGVMKRMACTGCTELVVG